MLLKKAMQGSEQDFKSLIVFYQKSRLEHRHKNNYCLFPMVNCFHQITVTTCLLYTCVPKADIHLSLCERKFVIQLAEWQCNFNMHVICSILVGSSLPWMCPVAPPLSQCCGNIRDKHYSFWIYQKKYSKDPCVALLPGSRLSDMVWAVAISSALLFYRGFLWVWYSGVPWRVTELQQIWQRRDEGHFLMRQKQVWKRKWNIDHSHNVTFSLSIIIESI